MRIAVRTSSRAVAATVEAVIGLAGHTICADAGEAELLIHDDAHVSLPEEYRGQMLMLSRDAAPAPDVMLCPLRPCDLVQRLTMMAQARPMMLQNGWQLDRLMRQLMHPAGQAIALTEKECDVLAALVWAYPDSVARDALLADVWAISGDAVTHTIETHLYRLRAKLSELSPPACDIINDEGSYGLLLQNVNR